MRVRAPASVAAVSAALSIGVLIAVRPELTARIGLGVVGIGMFAVLPNVFVAAYLFALPLLKNSGVGTGLKPGETVTLFVLAVGSISLLAPSPRMPARVRWIILALGGLCLVGVLSAVANGITERSALATLALKPLSWAVILYLVVTHFNNRTRLYQLLGVLVAAAAAVGFVAIYQKATGTAQVAVSGGPARATGTFEDWNTLGGFMALMVAPTFAYALSRKGVARGLALGAFVVEVISLLLSVTLGAIFAVAVAALFALPLWRVRPKMWLTLGLAPIVTALAFSLLAPQNLGKLSQARNRATDRLASDVAGYKLAKDHPWFGIGDLYVAADEVGSKYGVSTSFGRTSSIPHNAFLAILVERGIFGMMLLAWIAWLTFRVLLESRPAPGHPDFIMHWGLLLGGVAFLVQNFSNSLLIHARLGLFFLVIVTVAAELAAHRGNEELERDASSSFDGVELRIPAAQVGIATTPERVAS
jgi:hypothetical protein